MDKEWDVFISHASEDKEFVVRPLDTKLRQLGLKTWVDDARLKLGDSLSRKIDDGLARSRAGIVILSKDFFAKQWPEYELRGLTALVLSGNSRIIPIWHGVSHADVAAYSPTLADAFAGNTSASFDKLAIQIVETVRPDLYSAVMRKVAAERAAGLLREEAIALSNISQGPIRHASLPRTLVNRIETVRAVLYKVERKSIEEWVEGFQRDAHPTSEIVVWEGIAARYARAVMINQLNQTKANEVYAALLMASLGSEQDAARILSKSFGKKARKIFSSMKFDENVFSEQSAQDIALMAEMNVDLEVFSGPELGIDLDYIRQLIEDEVES